MSLLDTAVFVLVNGAIFGSLLALTAVGLSLIFGVLDVPNFAQGEFAALGGFAVVGFRGMGLGLAPSIVAAVAVTFVAGVVTERVVIARFYGREDFLLATFFATFGLTIISENALRRVFVGFNRIEAPDLGSVPVAGSNLPVLWVVAGATAVVMLAGLYLFTRYTYVGLAMRAVSDDRRGAQLVGVDYERIYMLTFGVGAALTGVSGVLYGMIFTLRPTLGVELTAFAFTIVVVGGVGSFSGVVAASLLIGLVESLTVTAFQPRWSLFAVFAVLFLVLTVKPGGIGGERSGRF